MKPICIARHCGKREQSLDALMSTFLHHKIFFHPMGKTCDNGRCRRLFVMNANDDGHKSQYDFISLPTYREPPRRLKAIINVGYFVSGWTWSGMTHTTRMHHGSISKGDLFVIYLMNGSVENQVDGSLDRSNSVFVKRGAVHRPPCLDFVAFSRCANPLRTLQKGAPPCFLGSSRTMIRTTTMIFLFFSAFFHRRWRCRRRLTAAAVSVVHEHWHAVVQERRDAFTSFQNCVPTTTP